MPSFVGTHLYIQAYALAPGANPLQIIISNGIGWIIGNVLRHAFAIKVYAASSDLQVTQAALGHASIVSTCIYAKVDKAREVR